MPDVVILVLAGFRGEELRARLPDQLLDRFSQKFGSKGIHIYYAIFPVDDEDHVMRGFGQRAVLFLTAAQVPRVTCLCSVISRIYAATRTTFPDIIQDGIEAALKPVAITQILKDDGFS